MPLVWPRKHSVRVDIALQKQTEKRNLRGMKSIVNSALKISKWIFSTRYKELHNALRILFGSKISGILVGSVLGNLSIICRIKHSKDFLILSNFLLNIPFSGWNLTGQSQYVSFFWKNHWPNFFKSTGISLYLKKIIGYLHNQAKYSHRVVSLYFLIYSKKLSCNWLTEGSFLDRSV